MKHKWRCSEKSYLKERVFWVEVRSLKPKTDFQVQKHFRRMKLKNTKTFMSTQIQFSLEVISCLRLVKYLESGNAVSSFPQDQQNMQVAQSSMPWPQVPLDLLWSSSSSWNEAIPVHTLDTHVPLDHREAMKSTLSLHYVMDQSANFHKQWH